jgi:peptidoglycan/xylan/chitin deacetylase (PgdA/CDA1 family)
MNPASNRLFWMYQKNKHLIDALLLHRAPKFVYQAWPSQITDEIPVITFHLALTDWFEDQCIHLSENKYHTLSAEEFNQKIKDPNAKADNCVFITFDDGLKHVWTVAYPLLKKYGLRATCYLIPGCISESDNRVRPTLEDVWNGDATEAEVMGIFKNEPALATWEEIKIMHDSGVIDFQSHTMNHALVPVSDEITGFVHPGYDSYYYGNIHTPLYTQGGQDVISRKPLLGMPIYSAKPRMQAEARYFDDEGLRTHCVNEVDKRGGRDFFQQGDWEDIMRNIVLEYKKSHRLNDRYENPNERDQALLDELSLSKKIIEKRLPGKRVTQLCYPWYDANDHAVNASRRAGYEVNLFGQRPGHYTNVPGQDPFDVVRVEELFLQRLPGKGRKSIRQTLKQMYELRSLPVKLFPEGRPGIL